MRECTGTDISRIVRIETGTAIVLRIGIGIMAQAFPATAKEHSAAIAAGLCGVACEER